MLKELPVPTAYHKIYEGRVLHMQINPEAGDEHSLRLLQAISHLMRHNIDFLLSQEGNTSRLVRKLDKDANQIIFLGYGSGILQTRNGEAEIVSCLCRAKLKQLLGTERPADMVVPADVEKILPLIDELLPLVGKIVVTDDPEKEIENCLGAGTLFFDESQLTFNPMNSEIEGPINDYMNEYYEKNGVFKPREDTGDTFMLRIKGSPISACTFFRHPNADGTEMVEIGKVWAGVTRNGLSQYTLQHATDHLLQSNVPLSRIFAITKERGAAGVFAKAGYSTESLRELHMQNDPALGEYLRQYVLADGEDRNVHRLKKFPSGPGRDVQP